ncbi:MAG: hypothetical protein OQJ89_15845 [Kangiellaceae bacterium]|nr:hypothetical protein [Kangiellaceae bacterium]MCW9018446.1 hypothetical protein [Kangiellaceae bacterium]
MNNNLSSNNNMSSTECFETESVSSSFNQAPRACSRLSRVAPINVEQLQLALSFAQGLVAENTTSLAMSMQEVGDIALPNLNISGSAQARDYSVLKTLAPLYLAFELEQAGVLKTAERVSGLFFSGAITQPLGEAEPLIKEFWNNRRQRLDKKERETLFQQTFERRYFYPQFNRFCEALVALTDNTHRNIHEEVHLDFTLQNLREYFYSRSFGMVTYVAEDILAAITSALSFLKQPSVLSAFSVRNLWELLSVSAGENEYKVRQYAEMASAGMYLINWLSSPQAGQLQLEDRNISQRIFSASHRWLLAYSSLKSLLQQGHSNNPWAGSESSYFSPNQTSSNGSNSNRSDANQSGSNQYLSSWMS